VCDVGRGHSALGRPRARYLDPLLAALREHDLDVPVVVGGSVVTAADALAIQARGVAVAFGPTAEGTEIVTTIERLACASTE